MPLDLRALAIKIAALISDISASPPRGDPTARRAAIAREAHDLALEIATLIADITEPRAHGSPDARRAAIDHAAHDVAHYFASLVADAEEIEARPPLDPHPLASKIAALIAGTSAPLDPRPLAIKIALLIAGIAAPPPHGDHEALLAAMAHEARILASHFAALVADAVELEARPPLPVGRPREGEEWFAPDDHTRLRAFRRALEAGEALLQRPRLSTRMDALLRRFASQRGLSTTLGAPDEPGGISRADWIALLDDVLSMGSGRRVEGAKQHLAQIVVNAYEEFSGVRAGFGRDPEGHPSGPFAAFAEQLDDLVPLVGRLRPSAGWGSYQPIAARRLPRWPVMPRQRG